MSRVLPILFNTEMVKAILDRRKTCTRRVIKKIPKYFEVNENPVYIYDTEPSMGKIYPPCQPGDILYVRETWHKYTKRIGKGENCRLVECYGYKASIANSEDANEPWKPSIHMPKEAARIWLKVTDVRLERLHDMTEDDALKEGAQGTRCDHAGLGMFGCTDCMNTGWLEPPIVEFMQIWDGTIKKSDFDHYCWAANPWVWVIEYERCENPEVQHE